MANEQEPAAWHFKCDEYESVTLLKEHADAMTAFYNTTPIPLYYAPTLTDEEREAIEWFAEVRKPLTRLTQSHNREKYKDTLCGLLKRTERRS
jgi:hypothetical protein